MVIKKIVSIILIVVVMFGVAAAEDLWEIDGKVLSESELAEIGIEPVTVQEYHEVFAVCNDGNIYSWFEDEPVSGRVHLLLFGSDAEVIDVIYYDQIENMRSTKW